MSDEQSKRRSEADAELERQIRADRKFSLSEAIGRLAGPGAMKGASPVTRKRQAELEIEDFLRLHLPDVVSDFRDAFIQHIKASELLLNNFDQPLAVLAG